ncbi:MAG: fimbrial biogenesis chaperone [Micavibrio sp.]
MIRYRVRNKRRNSKTMLLTALAVACFFCAGLSIGMPEAWAIKLTLKRVIFEGSKRTEVLTLINDTAEEQVYRLSWRNMHMNEGGGLIVTGENETINGLAVADKLVIFAPRRIAIPPGGSQQVRLMLRKPKDLADGEYRSHLWIRPEAESVKFEPNPQANPNVPSIQIKMLAGISFPVFVLQGKLTASGSISDLKFTQRDQKLRVDLTLNREGNRSIYGDFDFICTGGAEEKIVHQVRGIALYTETASRKLDFSFNVPNEGVGICKTLRVTYSADAKDEFFSGKKIAEGTATLQ